MATTAIESAIPAVAQLDINDPNIPVSPQAPLPATNNQSSVETQALAVFRQLISDAGLNEYQSKDAMLMRWLMAREMDPVKAAAMLKENLEWRKDNDMDNILNWEAPAFIVKEFPFQLCGLDSDGDLFGVVTWRKMNVDGAIQAITEGRVREIHLRYLYKALETVHKIYEVHSTPDKPHYQGTVIIDLDGFSAYQFASREVIEIVLEVVRRYEGSYPNMLKHAIIVNTPTVFTVLWNMMKPFLSEYTLSRVQIYSWVGQDWRSVLRKTVPVQLLPSHLGGANTTVKYYEAADGYINLQPPPLEDFPRNNMVMINVPACQKVKKEYQIDTPGTMLSWGFRSDYYDIGFTVLNEADQEVVDNCRVEAHIVQQKGFYLCNTPGKYTFVFDNSFSQYRAKSVYYTVKVTPPSLVQQ